MSEKRGLIDVLNVLVLEDDLYTRQFFKKLLEEIPEVSNIIDTSSGEEAVTLAKKHNPDLIMLDIELLGQELTGLEVAKRIYNFNKEVYMVFVTAYSQYAVDCYSVHPYTYIIKPIIIDEFKDIVKEIANDIQQKVLKSSHSLVIKSGNKQSFIRKDDIIFIEVQNKKLFIHTKYGILNLYESLTNIEKQLGCNFLRVHKSFIVNVNEIKSVEKIWSKTYEIGFWNYSEKVQMSRDRYKKYKLYFNKL